MFPASANAPGTSSDRNLEARYPLPSMGCDSISGQAAAQRLVRPVRVTALPDSVYFSRLAPSGVNATQRIKMTGERETHGESLRWPFQQKEEHHE